LRLIRSDDLMGNTEISVSHHFTFLTHFLTL
jgi:hypothetical protein